MLLRTDYAFLRASFVKKEKTKATKDDKKEQAEQRSFMEKSWVPFVKEYEKKHMKGTVI